MSSPVGHTVVGAAVGALYFLKPSGNWSALWNQIRQKWTWLLLTGLFANLPDLDFIPGILVGDLNLCHHGITHTLGWIALVSLLVRIPWRAKKAGARELTFIFILLFSHLAVDWATADGKAPYGIMMLWPFSDAYYISGIPLLPHLRKADMADLVDIYNVGIMAAEFALTLPLLAVALRSKIIRHPAD